jgi:type IV pilus assembly protein PilW
MARHQKGLTLVELMISMVLGLIVIGGTVSLTLSNRRSYNTNEGLSQVQESGRTAFEFLARDIRQAGITGCDNEGQIANVLDPVGTDWWQDWFGLQGFDGADASTGAAFGAARGDRIAGTDSLQTQGIQQLGMSIEVHDAVAATMEINAASTDIVAGDIMMACDFDHAAIFQVSSYDATGIELTIAATGGTPGNCSVGLGFPTVCTPTGTTHAFPRNSLLASFGATEWYVGASGRAEDSGRALFRLRLGSGGVVVREEVVTDVTDMQITYRIDDADGFVAASTMGTADWALVNAIRIQLTVNSADSRVSTTPGATNGRLERSFDQVVALRNRIP